MQESCTYGSMRGAPSNGRPYRNREIGLRSGSVNRRQTGRRRSDHGDTAMAVGAVDESCRLNRGNLNILSEARIHAPELIGYQVSVDPI